MALTEALIHQKTKSADLTAIKSLNLWGSELNDVSVLGKLTNLEILALSVNHVTKLHDVARCKMLRELFLRKNEITELSEVRHLSQLPHLSILWLIDNPVASHPLYRLFTIRCCTNLKQLDSTEVSPQERVMAAKLDENDIEAALAGKPRVHRENSGVIPPPSSSAQAEPITIRRAPSQQGSRRTEKAILAAILSLTGELSPEGLEYLYREIGAQMKRAAA